MMRSLLEWDNDDDDDDDEEEAGVASATTAPTSISMHEVDDGNDDE